MEELTKLVAMAQALLKEYLESRDAAAAAIDARDLARQKYYDAKAAAAAALDRAKQAL